MLCAEGVGADDVNERDIFIAARHLESSVQRRAYLDDACGTDADLRQRMDELFQCDDQAGNFLAGAALAFMSPELESPIREAPGSIIGPYKLLQQIGVGGMGIVFMAEQSEPVRRVVALKIIKPGMNTREVIARFEAERQALALMDHPNIAKVLDVGTTASGHPFFAMELVKGRPITQYCDEHRLSPRQRLELFIPVCQAIQHAHQKGLIHRDIKPSNILIAPYDGQPVVKIIDFGVAKATGQQLTDKTLFTQFGALIGTLEYMSPEQAELNNRDIDTRSDIYSLGVLLYELLTGTTPLDRSRVKQMAFDEILRTIRDVEPPKPSTRLLDSSDTLPTISAQRQTEPAKLTKLVRGELDWIVMRALDKDRNRRYETANGLGMDVERYLADEPVQACPPSTGYRLRKFLRRNRGSMISVSLLAMALLLGTGVSIWQAQRATHALVKAEENSKVATSQKERAERNLLEAHKLVAILTHVGHHSLHAIPGTGAAQRELVENALAYIQKYLDRERPDPMFRYQIGLAYYRAGITHKDFGETARAVEEFRTSVKVFDTLSTEFPEEVAYRAELAGVLMQLAWIIEPQEEARQTIERVVAIRKQIHSEFTDDRPYQSHADLTLGPLYSLDRTDACWSVAQAYMCQAGILMRHPNTANLDEAEKKMRLAAGLAETQPIRDPILPQLILAQLGNRLTSSGRSQEAIPILERAVASLQKILDESPLDLTARQQSAYRQEDLGRAFESLGRFEEAETAYRASVAFREKLASKFPNEFGRLDELNAGRIALARVLSKTGRCKESFEVGEKMVASCFEQLSEADDTKVAKSVTASALNNLAWLLATAPESDLRNPIRAVECARQAVELNSNASFWNTLGVAYYRAGDWTAAIDALEKSEELSQGANLGLNGFFLAMAHYQLGHHGEARKWYDESSAWTAQNGANDEELRRFCDEAAELLNIAKKVTPTDDPPPE